MKVATCIVLLASAVVFSFGTGSEADSPQHPTSADLSHALFSEILGEHVTNGRVDYRGLCQDERLDEYLAQLAATDPNAIGSDAARLAFWINVYNAYTLKIVCDNYPLESITDLHFGGRVVGTVVKKTVWDKKFVSVGGYEKLSLNHVEHEIVRPVFGDARAHYALVCASKSCPPLRPEAFEGGTLDEQLDDQARVFFGETDKNHFDTDGKVAYLSKILDWYADDFGKNNEAILLAIAPFLPPAVAQSIRDNPDAWDIKHTKYDWSLNE